MVEDKDPVDYFGIGQRIVRASIDVKNLDTPRTIQENLEQGAIDDPDKYLEYQERKRMQIMQGFHEEIEFLRNLREEVEDGDFE